MYQLANASPLVQQFEVASFQWLHLPGENKTGMSAALVTVEPRCKWPPHAHSGYEQFIYCLSGSFINNVGTRSQVMTAGDGMHIPNDTTHSLEVTGEDRAVFLAIYNPVPLKLDMVQKTSPTFDVHQLGLTDMVDLRVLQDIQDRLAKATGLGVIILDGAGKPVTEPALLPPFCRVVRSQDGTSGHVCTAFTSYPGQKSTELGKPFFFGCCCGISCVTVPITIDARYLGSITCGFALVEPRSDELTPAVRALARSIRVDDELLVEQHSTVPEMLKTPLLAAADSLQLVTNVIVELAVQSMKDRTMREYSDRLARETEAVSNLQNALAEANMRMIQAQISPHFLFNSLNLIAGTIHEDPFRSEKTVYSLSDFLRYILDNRGKLVPLEREVACIRNYVAIQQGRFGSSLRVQVRCSESSLTTMIPAMTLQPLVENAITHGLAPRNFEGTVTLTSRMNHGRVLIVVQDDGVGMDTNSVLDTPGAGAGGVVSKKQRIGLAFVTNTLKYHFGDGFSVDIKSLPGRGTRIALVIPAIRMQRDQRQEVAP
ncbi:MAG: PocR ligand-binding domain-containing protein [Ignavibacteriales bacterium]